MSALIVWLGTAAVVCGFGLATDDPRAPLIMLVVSWFLPEELFTTEE